MKREPKWLRIATKWLRIATKVLLRIVSMLLIGRGINLMVSGDYLFGCIAFGVSLIIFMVHV